MNPIRFFRLLVIVSTLLLVVGVVPTFAQVQIYFPIPEGYDSIGYIYSSDFIPSVGQDWDATNALGIALHNEATDESIGLYFENNQVLYAEGDVGAKWVEFSEWQYDLWILSKNVPAELMEVADGYILAEIPTVSYNRTVELLWHRTDIGESGEVLIHVPELSYEYGYSVHLTEGDLDHYMQGTIPAYNNYFFVGEVYEGPLPFNTVGLIELSDGDGQLTRREWMYISDLIVDFEVTNLQPNADMPLLGFSWSLDSCDIIFDATMTNTDQYYVYNSADALVSIGDEATPLTWALYNEGYRFEFIRWGQHFNYKEAEFFLLPLDPTGVLASYITSNGCA